MTLPSSAARFRAAVEAGDLDTALAQFAEDVVFNSPVVFRPYQGREALRVLLSAVFTVFENFRYTAEYAGPDGHVLAFRADVDGRELQGVDILTTGADPDALLSELTVLVRPYSAATALRERMAALLSG
ncbi:MAG TPA: nuclear transport factor 2 family protein [Pseudonocardia sp.]|uniref:nuclear transport factor 2 family protein n=1 Tax=Pseudonocardia sp. TaxID=60912 RepID=UPI002D096B17|nr:nuclear transport factor 2 family protein [Pseudonocardia sp.]HTF53164.1 nuclear transport factor 2 family protein [Pseudonocardia sp.]